MKVAYDRETDALSIVFRQAPVAESDERAAGLILDFDADGEIVAIELLDASRRIDPDLSIDLALASVPSAP